MLGEKDTIELSEIYFQQAKNILQEKKLLTIYMFFW